MSGSLLHARPALAHWTERILNARPGELPLVLAGFALFFCLFAGYFALRPVRETMGITAGVDKLQWLFTATFMVMFLAVPAFGALAARISRSRLFPVAGSFFIVNLLGFAWGFAYDPGNVWLARTFYVWLSVFNLFVVSLAWSLLADVVTGEQAKRLFAFIASGASVGGLVGPLLGAILVARIGLPALTLVAAAFLLATMPAVKTLLGYRSRTIADAGDFGASPTHPIAGGALEGLWLLVRSPYLLGIAGFVVLLATTSTFLYFEQARSMAENYPDRLAQTQVFSLIDAGVQALTIAVQTLVTGRLAQRYGVTVLLVTVPLIVAVGMAVLAVVPVLAVLIAVMVLRRAGEYALVRPGREMLFVPVDAATKYKSKNAIDTVVYRGADAVSAWVKNGIDAFGLGPWLVAVIGAAVALIWAGMGYWLGRHSPDVLQGRAELPSTAR